jgi:acetylornithine deacetylase/succinyl-diaminopimelate desuccinylase-like protein
VPELCSVTFDRRLLIGETEETVLAPIRERISALGRADSQMDAEAEIAGIDLEFYTGYTTRHSKFAPAWYMDRESNAGLIDASVAALRAAGLDPKVSTYKFCTNGSASAGIHGIPTIGFGPCAESQAHVADEYIEIAQLEGAAKGYYHLIDALCKLK